MRIPQQANIASCSGFRNCKWIPQNVSGIRRYKWNTQTKMRIPLTVCGICLQLRIPQQLNVFRSYCLFVDSTNCSGFRNCKWIPQNVSGIRKYKWNAQTKMRIPLTVCGICLQLRIPQQLNVFMSHCLFVDSTNCSGFRKYSCGFRKFAYFRSNFERYNASGICLWNPKQYKRSNKGRNVVDSATNLILTCCGISLQCTECTVWPRIGSKFNQTGIIQF